MTRKHLTRMMSLVVVVFAFASQPSAAMVPADDAGCMNGGAGASECHVEIGPIGCEVTCAGGYFACCTLSGCHCKPNA